MSERMNKERAREILKTIRHNSTMQIDYTIDDIDQALDIAIESLDENQRLKEERDYILEKAKAELKDNEWTDVRDRLPNESGIYDVLATIDFGNYRYVQIMTCEDNIFYFNNGGWSDDSNTDKVIAWKPLPHPYKRKE